MAVAPDRRAQGDPADGAAGRGSRRLYERLGFERAAAAGDAWTMVLQLACTLNGPAPVVPEGSYLHCETCQSASRSRSRSLSRPASRDDGSSSSSTARIVSAIGRNVSPAAIAREMSTSGWPPSAAGIQSGSSVYGSTP